MVGQRYGRMVFVSSVSGLLAHPHHAPYAATKGGINQMLRVMAREWARHGVTVNAVAPGYIETDLTKAYLDKDSNRESLESLVPAERLGRPEEVADAVTFLASDRAALHHRPGPVRRRRPRPGLTDPSLRRKDTPCPQHPFPSRAASRAGPSSSPAPAPASAPRSPYAPPRRAPARSASTTAAPPTGPSGRPSGCAAEGSTAVLLQADIVDWEQIKAMADAAFEQLGGVDALVNNVGDVAREQMSWRDITEESIDHVLAVDIKGTMLCVHEFGARMLDQGHGSIVNIGSTVIVRGSARAPQYAAAKYGLLGLTKSYAHAFAPTVRVNVFAPGFIETEATLGRKDWQSGRGDQLRSLTPMGRIPGPAELAGTALFLATDDASHMTGGYMVADGGYNMVGA